MIEDGSKSIQFNKDLWGKTVAGTAQRVAKTKRSGLHKR